MLPRNLTLFRFPSTIRDTLTGIDAFLPARALKSVGPLELSSRGFVSPFGAGEQQLSYRSGHAILFTVGGEDKILPSAVVNKALSERLDAIREGEGRNVSGRERKRIKDEVLTDLLPRAFARPSRVNAWTDIEDGWLVVDTANRRVGESVVTQLREAFGSFPALPVNAESSVRALLTAWLTGEALPKGFAIGDECELRDPVDAGAVVRCKRQELDSDEVREHVKAGKQCFALELIFEDRLAFVLSETLVVRKLRFLETATEALERDERDSLRAEIDATFALVKGEVQRLLRALESALSLSGADA